MRSFELFILCILGFCIFPIISSLLATVIITTMFTNNKIKNDDGE